MDGSWSKQVASQYVFCGHCQTALLPEHLRCAACGAPRPEYRPHELQEWPEYERRAVVAMSTVAMGTTSWNTT